MKELVSLLREVLTFIGETVGHPDPAKRTSVKTIIIVMVLGTVLLFAYNYGGQLVTLALTEPPEHASLLKENIELRMSVNKLNREKLSCISERDQLFESYTNLLSNIPPSPPPLIDDSFYDRLGDL